MVACYRSCRRLAALSEVDTRVVSPVRGMQQATKPAQRPFNNVLGPCKRQTLRFISISLISWLCFLISSVQYSAALSLSLSVCHEAFANII